MTQIHSRGIASRDAVASAASQQLISDMTDFPRTDNLKTTYQRWQERRHPSSCATCQLIWGPQGAPESFADYAARYPGLEHGQKRHLTQQWNPGLSLSEVARLTGCKPAHVRTAIDNGMLDCSQVDGKLYVTRTQATLWSAAGAPAGDSVKSWVRMEDAMLRYGFSELEMERFIAAGRLKVKDDAAGRFVPRRQCGQLRDELGFSPQHAAARLGIEPDRLPGLLEGLTWRPTGDLIPLAVIRAAAKRLEDLPGFPRVSTPPPDGWVPASAAAEIAGVSLATIDRWTSQEEVTRQYLAGGWHYDIESVKSRARDYWTRHPDRPGAPRWVSAELRKAKAARKTT